MQGSVKKRGKSWTYYFDIGKVNGKRKQKTKGGFRTKVEAQAALRAAIKEYEVTGSFHDPEKISLSDFSELWINTHVKMNTKVSTHEAYARDLRVHLIPAFGNYYLSNISSVMIQKFLSDKSNNYSQATLANFYGELSSLFKFAVQMGYAKANPLSRVTMPKVSKSSDIVSLTVEEINKIIDRLKSTALTSPFIIALNTGLRAGEVMALRWSDIDFDKNTITISKQLQYQNKFWVFNTPKTFSSNRNIQMNSILREYLIDQKVLQEENRKFYGDYYISNKISDCRYTKPEIIDVDDFVNVRENGEMLTTNSLKYISRVVNRELGIKFKFHYLRHTHATLLLQNGVNPKVIQERLGHARIATTLDTYSHVTANMQNDAVLKLDNALKEMSL